MTLAACYIKGVTKSQGGENLANWTPTQPVRLGDYGRVVAGQFSKLGNIKDLKELNFVPKFDEGNEYDIQFTSSCVSHQMVSGGMKASAVAGLVEGDVGLTVSFGKEAGVFLTAAGCVDQRYGNIAQLGEKLRPLIETGPWKREYKVVTSVTKVTRFAAAVSKTADSSLVLKASVSVAAALPTAAAIDLKDPKLILDVASNESGMLTFIGKPPEDNVKEASVLLMKLFRFKKQSDLPFVPKRWIGPLGGMKTFGPTAAPVVRTEESMYVASEEAVVDQGIEDEFAPFTLEDLESEL